MLAPTSFAFLGSIGNDHIWSSYEIDLSLVLQPLQPCVKLWSAPKSVFGIREAIAFRFSVDLHL